MIKQILGKLPRKQSSKLPRGDSNSNDVSLNLSSNSNTNSGQLKNPAKSGMLYSSNGTDTPAIPSASPTHIDYVAASESLPSLRDVSISERQDLFVRKLTLCTMVFDFTDPTSNLNEKDAKQKMLLELVDYMSSVNTKFNEVAMQEITKMVSANLFRALRSSNNEGGLSVDVYDPEDDESSMDLAWPHLQIVYEFLLRFVTSSETDAKLAKRYIDHSFLLRLLELFDSEDQREREYLKTILHRIYGKFMVHRPFIRKAINNVFYQFISETKKHNGISQLLEILGSIINGFALPLKEEHKLFLVRALIPLHKPKCMSMYHQQLSYCIIQFVEKDVKLADTVIRGLLKYWPLTNCGKEVLFLGELEEVLEATQPSEFQRCMVPLSRQIARCISSSHFQVAERSLLLWNNDHIRSLTIANRKVILPFLLPALEKNARAHWNQAVRSLTLNVRKIFSDADSPLFDECLAKFEEDEMKENEVRSRRETAWKRLEDAAAASAKSVSSEPVLVSMFQSSVSLSPSSNPRTALGN